MVARTTRFGMVAPRHSNGLLIVLATIIFFLSVTTVHAATPILSPTASAVCYTSSINDSACYDELLKMQRENGNVTRTVGGALITPWYDSSTACGVVNLKNGSSCNIAPGGFTFDQYCQVSDEHSQQAINYANGNNESAFEDVYDFLNNSNTLSVFGSLPGWRCVINETAGSWDCRRSGVNTNGDSASDADARYIRSLYEAAANTRFSQGGRDKYQAYGDRMIVDFVSYDLRYQCTNSTIGVGPICWWQGSGGNASNGGFAFGDFYYSGYPQDSIGALMAAYASTGNVTYVAIAQNLTAGYLQLSNWTGSTFSVPPGRSGHIILVTVGAQTNVPMADCDNTCTPDKWDSADAPRAAAWGEAQYLANLSGVILNNMTTYLNQWYTEYVGGNNNSYPYSYYANGTQSIANQSGYLAQGWQSQVAIGVNQTQFVATLKNAIAHVSPSTRTPDSAACFGVYNEAFMLRSLAVGLGRTISAYEIANDTTSMNGINITVLSPLNNSLINDTFVFYNITVWNNNNTDETSNTPGPLPQTLYNSTFSTSPASDGWTLNSWTWSSDGGGVINNTADSGGAAWTQNLNLTSMTNGYNVTLNMSLSNFTNAKLFFGTTSGTQSGDRILFERNGNNINVKHDGGSFGSFTVPMKEYITLYIVVNLSANTINVSSGASKWGDTLANSHLTVNGSYLAFVPGQNMSLANQNSTGWNISSINVTNLGTPYNITSTTTGNSTINVSIKYGNGTVIYAINGVTNGTSVNYTQLGLPNGTYYWLVTAITKDGTASVNNMTFTINTSTPSTPITYNVSATAVTNTSALITVTASINGNLTVQYGPTTALGSFLYNSTTSNTLTVTMSGLTPSTTYYMNITWTNATIGTNTSGYYYFTTNSNPASSSGDDEVCANIGSGLTSLGALFSILGTMLGIVVIFASIMLYKGDVSLKTFMITMGVMVAIIMGTVIVAIIVNGLCG